MNADDSDGDLAEYRGLQFRVEARPNGEVWTGHYRVLDTSQEQVRQAAEAGRHQWRSMDPFWGTSNEARRNATQAAHAAIDALRR